ncbi:hypothetical protein OG21DRAFT_1326620 [Imleria badia]|nr:hypothetical protein OG21DRAFT_1326620 [Imleria badia]
MGIRVRQVQDELSRVGSGVCQCHLCLSVECQPFCDAPPIENAIAQTAARFLWLAGQLGESAGGFQRDAGENRTTRNALQWRLHLNPHTPTLQRTPHIDLWNECPRGVPLAGSAIRSTSFAARADLGASFGQVESSGDVWRFAQGCWRMTAHWHAFR